MIVKVIVCDVSKDRARELQSFDTSLVYGVRAYFHKTMTASFGDHLHQQLIDADRIGSCVSGGKYLISNSILNGRK